MFDLIPVVVVVQGTTYVNYSSGWHSSNTSDGFDLFNITETSSHVLLAGTLLHHVGADAGCFLLINDHTLILLSIRFAVLESTRYGKLR